MTEEPAFTPISPPTRKPKRNYLIVWVFACLVIGAILIVLADQFLPGNLKEIGRIVGGILTPVFWLIQAWGSHNSHYRKPG